MTVAPTNWGTNPGTPAAKADGCLCPTIDNGHGNPEIGQARGFVYVAGCPLHSPKDTA